jgi:hypothetical protein
VAEFFARLGELTVGVDRALEGRALAGLGFVQPGGGLRDFFQRAGALRQDAGAQQVAHLLHGTVEDGGPMRRHLLHLQRRPVALGHRAHIGHRHRSAAGVGAPGHHEVSCGRPCPPPPATAP